MALPNKIDIAQQKIAEVFKLLGLYDYSKKEIYALLKQKEMINQIQFW